MEVRKLSGSRPGLHNIHSTVTTFHMYRVHHMAALYSCKGGEVRGKVRGEVEEVRGEEVRSEVEEVRSEVGKVRNEG